MKDNPILESLKNHKLYELEHGKFYGIIENDLPVGRGIYTNKKGIKFIGTFDQNYRFVNNYTILDKNLNVLGKFQGSSGPFLNLNEVYNLFNRGGFCSSNVFDLGDNFYEGDKSGEKKEGKGTIYFSNGTIYSGEWKNDKPHGKGEVTLLDNTKITGEFIDGNLVSDNLFVGVDSNFIGKGRISVGHKEFYFGDLNNGPNGYGILLGRGFIFFGDWKDGLPVDGTFIGIKTTNIITGIFHNSYSEGTGTILFNGQIYFSGGFENHKPNEGLYKTFNDKIYEDIKNIKRFIYPQYFKRSIIT